MYVLLLKSGLVFAVECDAGQEFAAASIACAGILGVFQSFEEVYRVTQTSLPPGISLSPELAVQARGKVDDPKRTGSRYST